MNLNRRLFAQAFCLGVAILCLWNGQMDRSATWLAASIVLWGMSERGGK